MSYRSNVVYVYDGSFEGMLTVIYEAFAKRELPEKIFTYENEENTLFPPREIESDEGKAKRVSRWLRDLKIYSFVYRSFLTCLEDRERDILLCCIEADKKGGKEIYNVKCEAAARLQKACRHLQNEAHLLTGFVRFKEISSVLIAEITPKNMVLPVIAPHFETRFPMERFIIIDRTHKSLLLYDGRESRIMPYTEYDIPPVSPEELQIERLWKSFYDKVAIKERLNLKCRMGHMPKRYWPNMTEMKDEETRRLPKSFSEQLEESENI